MKRTVIFLPLALIINFASAQSDEFRKYYCENGNFTISAEGYVNRQNIPQYSEGRSYTMYFYSFSADGIEFSASYYPIVFEPLGIENEYNILLNNMVQGAADNSGGKITKQFDITYKGNPGKEFIIAWSDGGAGRSRIYIIDQKVYMMQAIVDKKYKIDNPKIPRFLNSFVLGDATHGSPSVAFEKTTGNSADEISLGDLESYVLSSKNTVESSLKRKSWKYVGTHNIEGYGTGYQYVLQTDQYFEQVIFYVDNRLLLYVPDNKKSERFLKSITAKYAKTGSQFTEGIKQEIYKNGKYSIIITFADKMMFMIGWNLS